MKPCVKLRTEVVNHALTKRNISQANFASKASLTPSCLSQLLTGKRHPSPATRQKLMNELELGFDELFEMFTDTPAYQELSSQGGRNASF